jgi:hypothetical protein
MAGPSPVVRVRLSVLRPQWISSNSFQGIYSSPKDRQVNNLSFLTEKNCRKSDKVDSQVGHKCQIPLTGKESENYNSNLTMDYGILAAIVFLVIAIGVFIFVVCVKKP